jgi:hypothetical protein
MHGSTEQLELLRCDLGVCAANGINDTMLLELTLRNEKCVKRFTVLELLERHGIPTHKERQYASIDKTMWERRPISQELVDSAVNHLFSLFLL